MEVRTPTDDGGWRRSLRGNELFVGAGAGRAVIHGCVTRTGGAGRAGGRPRAGGGGRDAAGPLQGRPGLWAAASV